MYDQALSLVIFVGIDKRDLRIGRRYKINLIMLGGCVQGMSLFISIHFILINILKIPCELIYEQTPKFNKQKILTWVKRIHLIQFGCLESLKGR